MVTGFGSGIRGGLGSVSAVAGAGGSSGSMRAGAKRQANAKSIALSHREMEDAYFFADDDEDDQSDNNR